MNELRTQIRRAHRRLICHKVLRSTTWSMLIAGLLIWPAILLPKIWPIEIASSSVWPVAWIAGALLIGLVSGLLWGWLTSRGALDAAIEIDLRCRLGERISSAFALSEAEQNSAAGRALLEDARHAVSRIDIQEHFRPEFNWHPLLPLVVITLAAATTALIPDATRGTAAAAVNPSDGKQEQIRQSLAELKKKLAAKKKEAKLKESHNSDPLINRVRRSVDEMSQEPGDRKQTLVKLNNLTKDLAERRAAVAGSQEVRDMLGQLDGARGGPTRRLEKALQDGNLQAAADAIRELSEQMSGEAENEQTQSQELTEKLNQMSEKLNQMLGTRGELAQKRQATKERMEKLRSQGQLAEAGNLQRRLDQLDRELDKLDKQAPQMSKLQELASELNSACNSAAAGKQDDASEKLEQLASKLEQLQDDAGDQLQLEEMMQQIAAAKNAMNCKKCGGKGCNACQPGAAGEMASTAASNKAGEGIGSGSSDSRRNPTGSKVEGYRSRVPSRVGPGPTTRLGKTKGPLAPGAAQEEVKQEIAGSFSQDPTPVNNQKLPRRERDQTREYFELLRGGN